MRTKHSREGRFAGEPILPATATKSLVCFISNFDKLYIIF